MNQKHMQLAAEFLDEYADRLGNDGCNDWDWPESWSKDDRREFLREAIAYNENRAVETVTAADVDDYANGIANHWACGLLAAMLRRSAPDAGKVVGRE